MEYLMISIDFLLHLDKYIDIIIRNYGTWTYLILFIIIFCETGLVVTPFLPGDSLVFAAGAFAAIGSMKLSYLYILFGIAAILGDTVNYEIGRFIGPKIFSKKNPKILKKEYLDRTHEFYEKHGGKTIIIARFIPIIRTFAPFVAGIGKMSYKHFISYNIIGGILWVIVFLTGGYYFGNLPPVRKNFTLVIFAIILISVLPAVIEFIRQKHIKKQKDVH